MTRHTLNLVLACGLVVASTSVSRAESQLMDRTWRLVASSALQSGGAKPKITYWAFKQPLSFSLLTSAGTKSVEDLIRKTIIGQQVDSQCMEKTLSSLSTDSQIEGNDANIANQKAKTENEFIKEKKLSVKYLQDYHKYKDAYQSVQKELLSMNKDEAEANSWKLKSAETAWAAQGHRADFLEMEQRLAKLVAPPSTVDVNALRDAIFADKSSGNIKYRLSVPVQQWQTFDSWLQLRRQWGEDEKNQPITYVDVPEEISTNEGSCRSKTCADLNKSTLINSSVTAVEMISPQIDLPWVTAYRKAISGSSTKQPECVKQLKLDRLILVRQVATLVSLDEPEKLSEIVDAPSAYLIDGFQFSGAADLGRPTAMNPLVVNGTVASPYYFVLGFTTLSQGQ